MAMAEKLYKVVKDLPEPAIAELVDFAEFLQKRKQLKGELRSNVSLLDLKGGLENSATFAGDPRELQGKLRDEWN